MTHTETRHSQGSVAQPTNTAGVNTTEAGSSRLHAPGRPQEVEGGSSRLHTTAGGRDSAQGMPRVASAQLHAGADLDTTEAGPARVGRFRG